MERRSHITWQMTLGPRAASSFVASIVEASALAVCRFLARLGVRFSTLTSTYHHRIEGPQTTSLIITPSNRRGIHLPRLDLFRLQCEQVRPSAPGAFQSFAISTPRRLQPLLDVNCSITDIPLYSAKPRTFCTELYVTQRLPFRHPPIFASNLQPWSTHLEETCGITSSSK